MYIHIFIYFPIHIIHRYILYTYIYIYNYQVEGESAPISLISTNVSSPNAWGRKEQKEGGRKGRREERKEGGKERRKE
jgi:hypothetical protein